MYNDEQVSFIGKTLAELPTPAFCVDLFVLKANCERMIERCQKLGVRLRPHMKTHKTIEGGMLMTGGKKKNVAVSTLREAYFFAKHGFEDILYAYPLTYHKFEDCNRLNQTLTAFHVMFDNFQAVRSLEEYLARNSSHSKKLSCFLEIDCGYNRTGLPYTAIDEGIDIVKFMINSNFLRFAGLYVHCGDSYNIMLTGCSVEDVQNSTVDRLIQFSEKLKATLKIDTVSVSVGSTPSCSVPSTVLSTIDEIHPGNYVFYDAQQYSLGSCDLSDIACTVLTRVVGHYKERHELIIDCGFLALTKQGEAALSGGYVIIKDEPHLKLISMTQELGKIKCVPGQSINFERYPIGSELYLYPYHSCATAALYDKYFIHEGGRVTEVWKPCRGW